MTRTHRHVICDWFSFNDSKILFLLCVIFPLYVFFFLAIPTPDPKIGQMCGRMLSEDTLAFILYSTPCSRKIVSYRKKLRLNKDGRTF